MKEHQTFSLVICTVSPLEQETESYCRLKGGRFIFPLAATQNGHQLLMYE